MKATSHKKTIEAYLSSTFACTGDEDNGIKSIATWDTLAAKAIVDLQKLCEKVAKTQSVLFRRKEKGRGSSQIAEKDLGKALLNVLRYMDFDGLQAHFPLHVFNPYLARMLALIEKLDLLAWARSPGWQVDPKLTQKLVDRLNEFVEAYRAETNGEAFKTKMKNYLRRSRENEVELKKLIDAVFAAHAKVMVIRLDLSYNKSHETLLGHPASIGLSDVKNHRDRLLKDVRKSFKDSLVTYAWKLEYGLIKGYHLHCLFFFDGSKIREDVVVAKLIGEKWRNGATEGVGEYFNCNGRKIAYKTVCVGVLSHKDVESIRQLKDVVATYLAKVDYFIQFDPKNGYRAFGKGAIPRRKPNGVGRPRAEKPCFGLSVPRIG